MEIILKVPDMSCGHCVAAIEGAVQPLAGVTAVTADLDSKTVKVQCEPAVTYEAVAAVIEDQGFTVER